MDTLRYLQKRLTVYEPARSLICIIVALKQHDTDVILGRSRCLSDCLNHFTIHNYTVLPRLLASIGAASPGL